MPNSSRGKMPIPAPRAVPTYDQETGQMFSEAQVRVRSRHHSDWIGEFKTPSLVRKQPQNDGTGARSLAATATTQVANQFRDLSPAHFAGVPWCVALGIWKQIVEARRESFHTWRTFASAYPNEMATATNRYHLHIRQPSLPLQAYFSGITSLAATWLACLRISPKETSIAELVAVANITNLGILDLSDGQIAIDTKTSSFDERVLRSWAEIAAKREGFLHLRVLLLGWQDIDGWLFKYLPYFPLLSHVIITDSQKLTQRNRRDWESISIAAGWEARHAKKSVKSLRPILDDSDFHRYSISGFLFDGTSTEDSIRAAQLSWRQPVLECWLGAPRKWTHILEDFPGTRTIYFDRVKVIEPSYNILETQPRPNLEALNRRLHSSSAPSRINRSCSKRSSQSTTKSRRNIPGLADIFDGLA